MTSVFLELPPSPWVASNDLAFAIRDRYPVTEGRSASRRLPQVWEEKAGALVQELAARAGEWVDARGKRCRIVGASPRGGVRIDGGPDGHSERTVSVTDLAWVLKARDEVGASGGMLDEAAVNRFAYLDGTPKSSTRWSDTGWALVLVRALM